jgi:hypothetical protein
VLVRELGVLWGFLLVQVGGLWGTPSHTPNRGTIFLKNPHYTPSDLAVFLPLTSLQLLRAAKRAHIEQGVIG